MQQITSTKEKNGGSFPFRLEDLQSWTIRRTDGSVTKFTLSTVQLSSKHEDITYKSYTTGTSVNSSSGNETHAHLSAYCYHIPKEPLFDVAANERTGINLPLSLYVGSVGGARQTKDQFDFVIDCADVINSWEVGGNTLSGDGELVSALSSYIVAPTTTRLLKIDWDDRQAPNVVPEFWTELNKRLHGDVMTCCYGGHGRSGTSFVCLLLNNAPDYDAFDAILHLRAVHCPRAIESITQHEYINDVAKFLGRASNALFVSNIKDYKAAFMASNKPTAVAARKMLGW